MSELVLLSHLSPSTPSVLASHEKLGPQAVFLSSIRTYVLFCGNW